jgi:8-oxo-dGTP pyrophosphatase MutT (NUDIX family)
MSESFHFTKEKWGITKDKKLLETPIFSLHEKVMNPQNSDARPSFYVLNAPEWINIIALTPENEIILVEQYRAGIDRLTLELPGGMVDAGESAEEAAKREMLEETGYSSENWSYLGKVSSNPAILSNYTHLYLAEASEKTAQQHTEGNEDIEVHTLPLDRFLELVSNGTVHHAIVVAAVAQYLLHNRL